MTNRDWYVENEISIDPQGNCAVVGKLARVLWKTKQFPHYYVAHHNCFYVLREPPESTTCWDIIAAQSTRELASEYMAHDTVLVDVTNAPRR